MPKTEAGKSSADSRLKQYAYLLQLSPDRLIFTGKQRGLNVEGMNQQQAIQAILDFDERDTSAN